MLFLFPVFGSPLYRFWYKNRQTKIALAAKQANFIWNGFRLWVAEGSTKNVKLQFVSLSSLFTLNFNILSGYHLLCILTSECMLAHAFTWSKTMKIMKKVSFLSKKAHKQKWSWFLNVFHHFQPCQRMRKHALAWLKYTTITVKKSLNVES